VTHRPFDDNPPVPPLGLLAGEPADPSGEDGAAEASEQATRFLEFSSDLLSISDFDGIVRWVNPAHEAILGYTSQEMLGRAYSEFLHPDDVAPTMAAAQGLFGGNPMYHHENRFRCKDGSYRWVHWTGQVIAGEELIYCIGRDITDRKQVEQALRESEEALRQATLELASPQQQFECSGNAQPTQARK